MAFVVLFSTLSFTVESHYCGNNLVDTAIFSKVKNCGMETSATTTIKKNCCKDEVEVLEGQDKLKVNTFDDLNLSEQIVLATFAYSYISLFKSLQKQTTPHLEYAPPNLTYNIHLLQETFLI
ncbi:MAG: hypothetical protein QNK89_02075 [Lacinutrix sp.]|uniref:HYC_CC_PP family protein n=1 Tax=Lacinutrix sp. TaxID=1937692 RepID=UPI0030A96FE6